MTEQEREQIRRELMESGQISSEADAAKVEQTVEMAEKGIRVIKTTMRVIAALPILLAGIVFFCVGFGMTASELAKSKDYEEAVGTLTGYDTSSLGGYVPLYTYEAGGQVYQTDGSEVKKDKEEFPDTAVIKYDPADPTRAFVKNGSWFRFALCGLGVIAIGLVILFWDRVSRALHIDDKVELNIR